VSLWLVVVVVTTTAVAVVTVGAVVVVAIGADAVKICKVFLKHCNHYFITVKPCQTIALHVCNLIFQQGKSHICCFVTFKANSYTQDCAATTFLYTHTHTRAHTHTVYFTML
jgi:hypothetical protein